MSNSDLAGVDDYGGVHSPGECWRKSSFSMSDGDCVEVATLASGQVGVRDSKAITDPHLRFCPDVWTTFVGDIRQSYSAAVGNLVP